MLDTSKVGYEFAPFTVEVDKWRAKFFAETIGETNAIYFEEAAAQAEGYTTITVPPTFPFVLEQDSPTPWPFIDLLNIDIAKGLHASQTFDYISPIYVGDSITVSTRIEAIYPKRDGALEFVELQSFLTNQDGQLVFKSLSTFVLKND